MRKMHLLGIGIIFSMLIACSACNNIKSTDGELEDKFSLLWEITGNGVNKPSYLYGTIHIYDTSIFKIPQEVYRAIDSCDHFALEIDFNEIPQYLDRRLIIYPDSTLDKLLAPEVYAEVINIPFIKMMGKEVNKIKPFFITPFLMIEDISRFMSVDIDLSLYAAHKNKNTFGIETIDEQMDMIDIMPLKEQAQGINDIYDYCKREGMGFHEAGKSIFLKMQKAYKEQNIKLFENYEEEFKMTATSPIVDSAMIAIRNINMADRISDFIQQGNTLFSGVGMLHLPDYKGMRGVVTLLKEKGYTIRPILIKL